MSTLLRHAPDTDAADVVRFRNGGEPGIASEDPDGWIVVVTATS